MREVRRTRLLAAVMLLVCLCTCLPAWGALGSVTTDSQTTDTPQATGAKATPAPNQSYPGLSMEATMGYNGVVTYMRKLPVRVVLKNDGADLTGVLAMNIYRDERYFDRYELPVSIAAGAEIHVDMPVELTMKQKQYRLEFCLGEECVASQTLSPSRVLDPSTLMVGVLSDSPQALAHLTISKVYDPLKRGELWQIVPLDAKTFPSDAKMLEAFSFLAVDGIDAGLLDAGQQAALDNWLRKGGIVIVGGGSGAGAGYPFFEKYTGITAGTPYQAQDITPALLSFVKSGEKPLGEQVLLSGLGGAKNVVAQDGSTLLLDVTPVGEGHVMTAAFSLSDKPLNAWQGTNVLWQRLSLAALGGEYQEMVQRQTYRDSDYIDTSLMGNIPIANDSGFVTPLLLLLAFVALVGFGSYLVLKKKDKREWMWVTIPAFSVVFALALLLIGNWTPFKQPVAVIADYVEQSADGTVTERASVSVAMPELVPMTVGVSGGEILVPGNYSTYYSYEEYVPSEPNQLRYIYRHGEDASLTFPSTASWGVNSLFVESDTPPNVKIDASCWWEDDGLHVSLKNQGEHPMSAGYVITSLGYCAVPELLPGQTENLLLKNPMEDKTKSGQSSQTLRGGVSSIQYNSYGNVPIQPGVLLDKVQQSGTSIYSIIQAIVYPEDWAEDPDAQPRITGADRLARSQVESRYYNCVNRWNMYQDSAVFRYVTFNNTLFQATLSVNGQPVRRAAQSNVVDIALDYQPVSKTGLVKLTKGSIPVYTAEEITGTSGVKSYARGALIKERYRYYRLVDKPAFCFVLPEEARSMKVSEMDIGMEYVYGDYTMMVYNIKTGEWQEIKSTKPFIDQVKLGECVNGEGELFIRFEPTLTTDSYGEISTPYMTMDGRVQ